MSRGRRPWSIRCERCDAVCDGFVYACPSCASAVVAEPELARSDDREEVLIDVGGALELGQGDTPLVGYGAFHLKLESLNPTLSFKDRAMALGVAHAKHVGTQGIAVASTGNAAVSASAFAAAAGLPCRVIVGTASNAAQKLDACRVYGAQVEEIAGDYSDAYRHAAQQEDLGWTNVSTTYRNPVLAEAYRLIAFELLDQLGEAPGRVVVPIGAGPLLRGIERGFDDARALGRIREVPRMIGVQAGAVAPLARIWAESGGRVPEVFAETSTVATAIADPLRGYEEQGRFTIEAVRRSRGEILAVREREIVDAWTELSRSGIWVEASAATALAAARRLPEERETPTVLMLTGHGVKAPIPDGL